MLCDPRWDSESDADGQVDFLGKYGQWDLNGPPAQGLEEGDGKIHRVQVSSHPGMVQHHHLTCVCT